MMTSTTRAPDTPFSADAELCTESGEYCCGQGQTQPFCDGMGQGDGEFAPVRYRSVASTAVYFSACKGSGQNA